MGRNSIGFSRATSGFLSTLLGMLQKFDNRIRVGGMKGKCVMFRKKTKSLEPIEEQLCADLQQIIYFRNYFHKLENRLLRTINLKK
jgi:hypothetical protein